MGCAVAGVVVRGEQHGVATGVGGGFGMNRCGAVGVMAGTLPGMLLHVHLECVRFVDFKTHFCIGLGAFMMGGVSVILVMIGLAGGIVTLCSSGVSTLYPTLCYGGGSYGDICISPWGSIHAWEGAIKVGVGANGVAISNLLKTRESIHACFVGGSLFNIVASLSMASCRCSFHIRIGT